MQQCMTTVAVPSSQPALWPGYTRGVGQWAVGVATWSGLGKNKADLQETASSICVTLAKWAVFGMPRHLMPWAWRHSWKERKGQCEVETGEHRALIPFTSQALTWPLQKTSLIGCIFFRFMFVNSWLQLTRGRYGKTALRCLPHWAGLWNLYPRVVFQTKPVSSPQKNITTLVTHVTCNPHHQYWLRVTGSRSVLPL